MTAAVIAAVLVIEVVLAIEAALETVAVAGLVIAVVHHPSTIVRAAIA